MVYLFDAADYIPDRPSLSILIFGVYEGRTK